MKQIIILTILLCLFQIPGFTQSQQVEIDSLVNKLRTADRDWTNYSDPLIKIGEPAVPRLIENALDKKIPQWNRRVSMETLNQIHSQLWVKPALKILFDENEIPDLRNRAIAGLRGFDLSHLKTELNELYKKTENQFYKSNLASLLLTADTSLAYNAFLELYYTQDGHIQRYALQNLIQLRPKESTKWLLHAIQGKDWMTANLAMDSLTNTRHFNKHDLLSVYINPGVSVEVQWRIVYVFGHRKEPESIPFLIKALQNKNWLVNNEAAIGIIRFDRELVLNKLVPLKKDDRIFVRKNTKWVMKQIKGK